MSKNFISTAQAAKVWEVSVSRVTVLCRDGRVPGAQKVGSDWIIPEGVKPTQAGRTRPGKIALAPAQKGRAKAR